MKKLATLIIAAVTAACTSPTERAFSRAEELMRERPDSALAILRDMEVDNRSKAQTARWALLFSQALDKNMIDLQSDSIISIAVDYYSRRGDAAEKAKAYHYQGRVWENACRTQDALFAYLQAARFGKACDDNYQRGLTGSALANLYYRQYSFEEAAVWYDSAVDDFERAGAAKPLALTLMSKAQNLARLDNYGEALACYSRAAELFRNERDTAFMLVTRQAVATFEIMNLGRGKEAYDLLTEFYATCGAEAGAMDFCLESMALRNDGRTREAMLAAEKALARKDELSTENLTELYALARGLSYQLGRYVEALDYGREYERLNGSDTNPERRRVILKAMQIQFDNRELELSNRLLAAQNDYRLLLIILVTALAAVAVAAAVLSRRKIIANKNARIDEYRRFAEQLGVEINEMQVKYRLLFDDYSSLDEKSMRLKTALDERFEQLKGMMRIAYLYENSPAKFYSKFRDRITLSSRDDDSLADLQEVVNDKYYGIIDFLKTEYPNLSNNDLNMCALICFGFSAGEIGLMYNMTNPDSIYNRRSRLRKKLSLTSDRNIETFIKNLVEELKKTAQNQ